MARRLTREHSEALRLALRLQASDASSAADDRRELLRYWYGSGGSHLRAEERLLTDAWSLHGGEDHPLSAAMEGSRVRLANAVAAVADAGEASPATMRAIGAHLAEHVHRHDRELYGAVERLLTAEEVDDLERQLALMRHRSRA